MEALIFLRLIRKKNLFGQGTDPSSAVIHFDVYLRGLPIEDMNVITSMANRNSWIFKPVSTFNPVTLFYGDGDHPLSGYRKFGLTTNNSDGQLSYTFFSRGIDRP